MLSLLLSSSPSKLYTGHSGIFYCVVQRIRDNFGWNRALCDKSTNFDTVVVYAKVTILKIGGTLKMP